MFELFLNAARFTVSGDVRESVSSILELIRRLPEWERDICTLEASIAGLFAEQATLLSGLTISKMNNLSYSAEASEAFSTIYAELVMNAFEHGCTSKKEKIKIGIDITPEYVALTVTNPKKQSLNIKASMERSKALLAVNSYERRGRGLLIVSDLADSLEETANKDGVKAVIYRRRVTFELDVIDDLTIIELTGGLHNPSLERRLLELTSHYSQNHLILDFSRYASYAGRWRWRHRNLQADRPSFMGEMIDFTSGSVGVILEVNKAHMEFGRAVVALLGYNNPVDRDILRTLPDALIAYSITDALQKVYRSNLLKKVRARIKRFRRPRQRLFD